MKGLRARVVPVAMVFALALLSSCGDAATVATGSSGDAVPTSDQTTAPEREDTSPDDVFRFRFDVINQTGQQHLSMTDFAVILGETCGVVGDPEALVDLAARWGLGEFGTDEDAASSLWISARQACPDAFSADDIAAGPPFGPGGSFSPPPFLTEEPSEVRTAFVDVDFLDEHSWQWGAGDALVLLGSTSLAGAETVAVLGDAFDPAWTVEAVGPLSPVPGSSYWSLDISGVGFSGAVDVFATDGEPTIVQLIVIDGTRPFDIAPGDVVLTTAP